MTNKGGNFNNNNRRLETLVDSDYKEYTKNVKLIASYLKVGGMFEEKTGMQHQVYNKITKNTIDYKQYQLTD